MSPYPPRRAHRPSPARSALEWSRLAAAGIAALALVLSPLPALAQTDDVVPPPPAISGQPTTDTAPPARAPERYADGLRSQKVRLTERLDTGTTPPPQQQITRVDLTRNLVDRKLTAKVTFAAAPTAALDSFVFVFIGAWSGNTCTPGAAIAAAAASTPADGGFYGSDGMIAENMTTTRSRSGNVLTITGGPHDKIRSAAWNCAYALNQSGVEGATPYTGFYADDLTNTFAPKVKVRMSEAMYGNYKGKKTKVRVEIDNVGKGDAKNVRVTASGSGLSISKAKRSISTLRKGRSEYLTFTVALKGSATRTLSVSAVASGGTKTTTKVKIVQKPKPKKYKSLSGRYFWGFMPTTLSDYNGWEPRTVWFLNSKWAYTKAAKDGKKPSCTKTTSVCKRYTYNAKTGVAKIGSQKFTVNTEGFTYKAGKKDRKKSHFEPITLLSKGAKFATDLKRDDWTGYCMLTCTATSERIAFDKKGRFVWKRSSVGSWTGIGSSWAIIPPDQRGTYKVISTGRVELRYSDGKKKRYTIGAVRDLRGKTSVSEGIILGSKNFY